MLSFFSKYDGDLQWRWIHIVSASRASEIMRRRLESRKPSEVKRRLLGVERATVTKRGRGAKRRPITCACVLARGVQRNEAILLKSNDQSSSVSSSASFG